MTDDQRTPTPEAPGPKPGPESPPQKAPPEGTRARKLPEENLPRIRTYASDLSEEMRERETTLSSIISAEKAARRDGGSEYPSQGGRRTLIIGGLAFLFILLGVVTVSAALLLRTATEEPVIAESIVFSNRVITVDATRGPLGAALVFRRRSDELSLGEIERIDVARGSELFAPTELATALGAPNALAREVEDIMVGIHEFDHPQPFIIFKVAAYDRAFSATLSWEPDMARSLGAFFAPTGAGASLEPPTATFTDRVIRNLDVRQSGSAWPILYAFPTQHLLIVTTNEYTLRELVSRLGAAR